jgi:hypothetical protein
MLLNVSDQTAQHIRDAGVVLMLVGGLLAAWALQRFDELPNYQRLALVLPLVTSFPLVWVDSYRAPLRGYWGGKAIGALIAPLAVALGSIIWYLVDASAKA